MHINAAAAAAAAAFGESIDSRRQQNDARICLKKLYFTRRRKRETKQNKQNKQLNANKR